MAKDDAIAKLQQRVDKLEHELGIQQDIRFARRCQHLRGIHA